MGCRHLDTNRIVSSTWNLEVDIDDAREVVWNFSPLPSPQNLICWYYTLWFVIERICKITFVCSTINSWLEWAQNGYSWERSHSQHWMNLQTYGSYLFIFVICNTYLLLDLTIWSGVIFYITFSIFFLLVFLLNHF